MLRLFVNDFSKQAPVPTYSHYQIMEKYKDAQLKITKI